MDAGPRIFFSTISQKVSTVPYHRIPANSISQSFTTAYIADIAAFKLKKKKKIKTSPYHSKPYYSSNISDSKNGKQRKSLVS